jgi:LRR receptor-like serine/threonine-protein kinase FLS2
VSGARPPLEHHGPSRHGKKLILINLSFNAFTGSIPEEFAELEAVMAFSVEGNKLSGNIPDSIRNWANARSISLAQNLFTGLFAIVASV